MTTPVRPNYVPGPAVLQPLGMFLGSDIPPIFNEVSSKNGPSSKPWSYEQRFHISAWDLAPNNISTVNNFFETPEANNQGDLGVQVYYQMRQPVCFSEGDVEASFVEHIIMPLKDAFHGSPWLFFASKHGNTGDGTTAKAKAVDWVVKRNVSMESYALCVGEIKQAGVIHGDFLAGGRDDGTDAPSAKLLYELKGYAFTYRVPLVFCYDGVYLLILKWNEIVGHRIINLRKPPKMLLVKVEGENGVHAREAMYRMVCESIIDVDHRGYHGALVDDQPSTLG